MDILYLIFLLLLAVGASRILANLIPLPLPILQIVLGSLLAMPPFGMQIELHPEIFMLLFIPPLLFYDGWKIPKREFTEHGVEMTAMSLVLVLLVVVVAGYFIHWLLPAIPLGASFALAAILSPTDALAVIAIGQGRLPRHMAHQLEGEAMMNDATGLVSFKFALAAAISGTFSLVSVAGEFVIVALGGLLIGAGLSWSVGRLKRWMTARGLFDPAVYVVMILLLPFAAFYLAEHAGMSGILSAVAAGMVQSRVDMLPVKTSTRILNRSIWEMLDFSFNGLVFLLLGLQFPRIVGRVWEASAHQAYDMPTLLFSAVAIMALLLAMRFAFVYAYHWSEMRVRRLRGAPVEDKSLGLFSALSAVAGVRGAITLAGVLSVPLMIGDTPFPGRDLMIFLAAAVIILSLLVGALGVPFFLKRMPHNDFEEHERELQKARRQAAQAAVGWLENWRQENASSDVDRSALQSEVAERVIESYRQDLEALMDREDMANQARRTRTLEIELRLQAIAVQRKELLRMRKRHDIDEQMLQALIRDLDYDEAALR
ncbi:Na+/H+ antiporter [Stutzerimonas nosocomialis]|uniref:Na+/H+ antiporter n=1 Tax=Stutzerimonas nosocomialis TaxID=1056496 RepID=UPI001109B8B7|nr:Na+/H+ antiporter [Stutzerimonas nosocomialis]TLX60959.1 Na+/H+ antiporter [Stutzerimonas nosocomialis]